MISFEETCFRLALECCGARELGVNPLVWHRMPRDVQAEVLPFCINYADFRLEVDISYNIPREQHTYRVPIRLFEPEKDIQHLNLPSYCHSIQ